MHRFKLELMYLNKSNEYLVILPNYVQGHLSSYALQYNWPQHLHRAQVQSLALNDYIDCC